MSECRDIEALLVDRALGELTGLKAALVEAHLGHCPRCRTVSTRLGSAFQAARSWSPEVAESELDRMAAQLGPYLEVAQRPRWPARLGLALAAVLAALGLFGLLNRPTTSSPAAPPAMAAVVESPPAASPAGPGVEVPAPPAPVVRRTLRPGLKVVASADWDGGALQQVGDDLTLNMTQGFVVLDFESPGQRLMVRTPEATVELADTRCFVEIVPGAPMRIGVLAGQAQLRRGASPPVELGAGEALEVGEEVSPSTVDLGPTAEHQDDDFLAPAPAPPPPVVPVAPVEAAAVRATQAPVTRPPANAPTATPTPAPKAEPSPPLSAEVLANLLEAEALARRGQHGEALSIYERVLSEAPAGRAPPTARFERARLLVKLGRIDEASPELDRLAPLPGEIGRQASILRCELRGGCAARACLEGLAGKVPAAELEQRSTRFSCAE